MKLLTAKVVMDNGDLTKVVTVPDLQMDPMESAIGLYEGEQLPRDVLLRAMLIVSANDAARALAVDVGGSQDSFVERDEPDRADARPGQHGRLEPGRARLGQRPLQRPRHGASWPSC